MCPPGTGAAQGPRNPPVFQCTASGNGTCFLGSRSLSFCWTTGKCWFRSGRLSPRSAASREHNRARGSYKGSTRQGQHQTRAAPDKGSTGGSEERSALAGFAGIAPEATPRLAKTCIAGPAVGVGVEGPQLRTCDRSGSDHQASCRAINSLPSAYGGVLSNAEVPPQKATLAQR